MGEGSSRQLTMDGGEKEEEKSNCSTYLVPNRSGTRAVMQVSGLHAVDLQLKLQALERSSGMLSL